MAQLLIDEIIVISADSTHNEAKMKLAEIYEILGADTEVIMATPRVYNKSPDVLCDDLRRAVFTSSCKQQHVDVWSEISKSRQKYTSTVGFPPFLRDGAASH